MCGIYARLSYYKSPCTMGKVFNQLQKLKHRGYDGIGIAIESGNDILFSKSMENDVNAEDKNKPSFMGLGHVRYRTKGDTVSEQCQPLINYGIALVHNGHINETKYTPDSLLLLSYFKERSDKHIFTIVSNLMLEIRDGSYSCIVMIPGTGLVVFRDPRGIRPLIYHHNNDRVIIASESRVVSENVKDVKPGECIVFHLNGTIEKTICHPYPLYTPCIFEYIYFAHKDSVINGIHVYKARQLLGRLLASRIQKKDFDVIVPVPKTSCVSAKELSRISEIPYKEILTVKKGRTFILSQQSIRINIIGEKFILDKESCSGKRILLVDDSIVRGNTMRTIIKQFEKTDCKHLGIASCAPPIFSKNVYGIDISSSEELITHRLKENDVEEGIARLLGVHRVYYQNLEEMEKELLKLNPSLEGFECSMFKREEEGEEEEEEEGQIKN